MDSFFAKKGLTLSRNANGNPQPSREQLLRSQEQQLRPPTYPAPVPTAIHSLQKHPLPHDTPPPRPSNNHSQVVVSSTREEKSFSIGASIRLLPHRELEGHPPKPHLMKFSGLSPAKAKQGSLHSSREDFNSLAENNRSFETVLSVDRGDTYSEVKPANKLKMALQSHRLETESAKVNKAMGYLQGRDREAWETGGRTSLQPQDSSQRGAFVQREKAKQQPMQARREGRFVPQEWLEQKYALLKEINQKTATIRELQGRLATTERQLKGKVSSLEFQVRMLEGSRSRLESESETVRQQLRAQKEKHGKAKQEMHRLIFFEDDLIHAKDYSRLKEELESVLTENALLFQEHQQYIIAVGEGRRAVTGRLEQVEGELAELRREYLLHRAKLEALSDNADDKMQLIKLQNELNFLRRKAEQSTEALIARERELEQAKLALQQLLAQQNHRSEVAQKFIEDTNLQQIKDTIASYQARLADMAEALAVRTEEVGRQKAQLQALTGEMRASREERHISSMKERSSENSLRNEVETLQRALQGEQEMGAKRMANLEECLQRKTKEIGEKDAFIKNFLLTRAKQLDGTNAEAILKAVRQYFVGGDMQ